jgi:uncharacterized protein involved in type VI secretion and phage assembly
MSADGSAPAEAELEAGGFVKGLAIGIVRQNKDDTGQVSVRVSYPWHSQPRDSYAARIAVPMAGKNMGVYFVPEVGDEVLVGFEKGSLEHPFVVGCLWNGADSSPEKNSDGNNDHRVIRTRKGHRLFFDDGSRGVVTLELNDGKKLTLDDDGIQVDDGKGNKISIQSGQGSMSLEAATSLSIKAPQVKIEATGTLDLKGGATANLKAGVVNIN